MTFLRRTASTLPERIRQALPQTVARHLHILGLCAALGACAYANVNGHVQFYQGDAQPDTATAFIRGETTAHENGTSRVRLMHINDRDLPSDAGSGIPGAESASVLPGSYTLTVEYLPAQPRYAPVSDTVQINVHAGCSYQVVASYNRQRRGVIFDVLPATRGIVSAEACAAGMWPVPQPH